MQENGFTVQVEDVKDLNAVKEAHQVPMQLQSCHTAIVDGYVIEGHVPAEDVTRLLAEKPDIAGLAVPGMPLGSPGMEANGAVPQPYDVIAFSTDGSMEVFASYQP